MGDGTPMKIFLVWCLGFVAGFSSGVIQAPMFASDLDSMNSKPIRREMERTTTTTNCPPCPERKQNCVNEPSVLDLFVAELGGQDPIFKQKGELDHNLRKQLFVALNQFICTTQQHSGPNNVRRKRVPGMTGVVSGLARLNKADFASVIDTGVPLGHSRKLKSDVLVLFGGKWSLPPNSTLADFAVYTPSSSETVPYEEPYMSTNDALKNCDQLAVINIKQENIGSKCFALLPSEESFHIQKWLRVADRDGVKVNRKEPFRLVSRGYDPANGREWPNLPGNEKAVEHRNWLGKFMPKVDTLVEEVKPLAEKVAVNNQLIIMAVNDGQSELFMNFACVARSRGFNVSNILVFIMDEGLKEVVEGLGMTAYYNEEFLGSLPSGEPTVFGDKIFTNIVISKFMCTYLMSLMGYDFLFQDVDIVWYKDPMKFFNDPELANPSFDIYFQDDINNGIRYQPFRGNSGFYYVRHNKRTVAAFKDAVLKIDQLFAARSHQQTLLEVLSEHVTYHGLRVKVYDGYDTDYFPLGYHFQKDKAFMQAFFRGEKNSWIFHINWTRKKNEKINYFRQMGEWFLKDNCTNVQESREKAASVGGSMIEACCSAEALFSCHYRDKPSKYPCKDSPTFDGGNANSWW